MINIVLNGSGFLNDQRWYLPPGLIIFIFVLSLIMVISQEKKDARYFGLL